MSSAEEALRAVCNAAQAFVPKELTPEAVAKSVADETKLKLASKIKALAEDMPDGEAKESVNRIANGFWREGIGGSGGVGY